MSDTALVAPEVRSAALDAEVARQLGKGWMLQSRTESQAVLVRTKKMGLFWNVVLTILTGGIWLIVIVIRMFNRKSKVRTITVDLNGKVRVA